MANFIPAMLSGGLRTRYDPMIGGTQLNLPDNENTEKARRHKWLEIVLFNEQVTTRALQIYNHCWPKWQYTILKNTLHAEQVLNHTNLWLIYIHKIELPVFRRFKTPAQLIQYVFIKPMSIVDFLTRCEQILDHEILQYDMHYRSTVIS